MKPSNLVLKLRSKIVSWTQCARKRSDEEEIRRRAYEIYLARGEESDNDLEDWLQAERELMTDQSEAASE